LRREPPSFARTEKLGPTQCHGLLTICSGRYTTLFDEYILYSAALVFVQDVWSVLLFNIWVVDQVRVVQSDVVCVFYFAHIPCVISVSELLGWLAGPSEYG
jgi:hypothetical protein